MSAVAEAPLTLATTRERGYRTRTLPYVPGSVVRGALAATWIRQHGPPGSSNQKRGEFIDLFEGTIRFGPLVPERATFEPVSVLRCKYEPEPACARPTDAASTDPPTVCPACHGPLERGKGRLLGPVVREITRVSLNPDETAVDGALYATEALPTGTRFEGAIHGSHPWLLEHRELRISVGRRKTIAGRVVVRLEPETDTPREVAPRADHRVLIRLRTPAIILDGWGAPLAGFNLDEIASLLGRDRSSIEAGHQSWCRVERSGGWHAASGLAKPDELQLVAGSTLLLHPEDPIPVAQLTELAGRSIGTRTNEGFGLIDVNPPPWSPPDTEPEASGSQPGSTSEAELGSDLAGFLTAADRRWLIGILRERRANPSLAVQVPRRRLRELSPGVRAKVAAAIEVPPGGQLDSLIRALQHPKPRTGR